MLRALAAVALEAASAGGHRRPDGCPTCALGARCPATSATARSGEPSAGGLYDDALVRHLRGRPGALHALDSRSAGEVVPVPRWCAPADESDTPAPPRLLRRLGPVPCSAPVLNVGSGLWRDAALLAERGVAWRGSARRRPFPTRVTLTRAAGAPIRLTNGLRLLHAT